VYFLRFFFIEHLLVDYYSTLRKVSTKTLPAHFVYAVLDGRRSAASAVCRLYHGDVGLSAHVADVIDLAMFPVLVVVYIRLARQEEKLGRQEFGR
jgi:hypothetical protein